MQQNTIFFDLGNVLLFFDTLKQYRQIASTCSLELEEVAGLLQHQIDPHEKGAIDFNKIYDNLCHLSKKQIDYSLVRHAFSDIFKPNDPVIEIVKELKNKHFRLFILSNTCDAHFEFAKEHFDFLNLFDGYLLSYKIGARKPQKKIFEEALKLSGCKKEECFYVDDIPDFVSGAKRLKIDAEIFTTPEILKSHLTQRHFL